MLVDRRPGGGGGIAMEMLARAAPDGQLQALSAITPLTCCRATARFATTRAATSPRWRR